MSHRAFSLHHFSGNKRMLPALAACLCLLMASIRFALNKEPINPDGLLYLEACQAYLTQGLKASLEIYSWPFFSILIGKIHQFSGLSLENSAYFLNLLACFFCAWQGVKLSFHLFPATSGRLFIFSALVWGIYPEWNRAALIITRDLPYWACLLFALNQLLQYSKTPRWSFALTFGLAQALACLFRIEAVLLWALLPFSLYLTSLPRRHFQFFRAQALLLCLGLLLILYLAELPLDQIKEQSDRLLEPVFNAKQAWVLNWQTKIAAINDVVLSAGAKGNGFTVLWGGSLASLLRGLFLATGAIYTFAALVGLRHFRSHATWRISPIMLMFFFLNFFILAGFAFQHQFLEPRYAVPAAWLILIFSTLGFQQATTPLTKGLAGLLFLWLCLGNVFHTGHSKAAYVDAGQWLRQQHDIEGKIFSNSAQILYYADPQFDMKAFLALPKDTAIDFHGQEGASYRYFALIETADTPTPNPLKRLKTFPINSHKAIHIYTWETGSGLL